MPEKKYKRKIVAAFVAAIFIALSVWIVWGNKALEMNTYTISSKNLPTAFDGFHIAHVSDLHNVRIGDDNEKLLSMLRDAQPDIIVITGDLIDSRKTDIEIALQFTDEAVKIAPCYCVTGNHEARVSEYDELRYGLTESGVTVLEDERLELGKSGETITLIGVNDPSFYTDYLLGDTEVVMQSKLQDLTDEDDNYTVLLSHRPELFEIYVESGVDLVLSGHAHGGQFRLPSIGGLIAPNQGLLPEYDVGLFSKQNTYMIVSRGIGNSIFPLRLNNRPEVVLIEMETAQ